jgi:hypothetical protein
MIEFMSAVFVPMQKVVMKTIKNRVIFKRGERQRTLRKGKSKNSRFDYINKENPVK